MFPYTLFKSDVKDSFLRFLANYQKSSFYFEYHNDLITG